jgi:hypothetical protein
LPLEELYTLGAPSDDFSPIRGLRLRKLGRNYQPRHADALRAMPTLRTINDKPAAQLLGGDG